MSPWHLVKNQILNHFFSVIFFCIIDFSSICKCQRNENLLSLNYRINILFGVLIKYSHSCQISSFSPFEGSASISPLHLGKISL